LYALVVRFEFNANVAANPTPASYTVSYNENTAAGVELGQVQAGDVDGDDVTFAISAGNDNGWYPGPRQAHPSCVAGWQLRFHQCGIQP